MLAEVNKELEEMLEGVVYYHVTYKHPTEESPDDDIQTDKPSAG